MIDLEKVSKRCLDNVLELWKEQFGDPAPNLRIFWREVDVYIITEPERDIWAASVSKFKARRPTAKAALEHLLLFTTFMRQHHTRLRPLRRLDQPTRQTYGRKPSADPYLDREIATMVELRVGYNLDWRAIEPVLPPRSSRALSNKFRILELGGFFEEWSESEEDAFRKVLHDMVRDKQWKTWQIDWDQVATRFPNKKWLDCLWLAHKLKCAEVGHRTQEGEDPFSTQASESHDKSLDAAEMRGLNTSAVAITAQPLPVAGTAGVQEPTSTWGFADAESATLLEDSGAFDLDPSAIMSGVDTSEAATGVFDPSKALGAFDPSKTPNFFDADEAASILEED